MSVPPPAFPRRHAAPAPAPVVQVTVEQHGPPVPASLPAVNPNAIPPAQYHSLGFIDQLYPETALINLLADAAYPDIPDDVPPSRWAIHYTAQQIWEKYLHPDNRRMPRDKRLIPAVVATLCDAIELGNPSQTACAIVGIRNNTFEEWLRQGDEAIANGFYNSLAAQFAARANKAEGQARFRNMATIQNAAATNWKAAAWFLERRDPQHFARKDVIVGDDSKPISVIHRIALPNGTEVKDGDLVRLAARVLEADSDNDVLLMEEGD